ncbi:MAG: G5 domain-containing protein [Clostridia bacterium]|nr:G5 domain-containing protein [Clostridia bacterium]
MTPETHESNASRGAAGAAGGAYRNQTQKRHANRTGAQSASLIGKGGTTLKRGAVVLIVCVLFGLIMLGAGVFAASSMSSNPASGGRESETPSSYATADTEESEKKDSSPEIGGGVSRTEATETDGKETEPEKDRETEKSGSVTVPATPDEVKQPETTPKNDPKYTVTFNFWDRDPIYAKTDGGTVRNILAENGYTLDSLHVTSIGADEWVDYDATVNVLTLRYETINVTEEIPYGTDYVYSDSVPSGQSWETTAGSVGYRNAMYTIEYINGEENYRSLDSEYITKYPTNQVITVGTAPSTVVSDSTGGYIYGADGTAYHYSKVITVKATYYNLLGGTASGLPVGDGIIATDPSVIPTGTSVYLKNDAMDLGVRLAADTGVYGAWVDVWMNENSPYFDIFAPTGVWEMTCYILD